MVDSRQGCLLFYWALTPQQHPGSHQYRVIRIYGSRQGIERLPTCYTCIQTECEFESEFYAQSASEAIFRARAWYPDISPTDISPTDSSPTDISSKSPKRTFRQPYIFTSKLRWYILIYHISRPFKAVYFQMWFYNSFFFF